MLFPPKLTEPQANGIVNEKEGTEMAQVTRKAETPLKKLELKIEKIRLELELEKVKLNGLVGRAAWAR